MGQVSSILNPPSLSSLVKDSWVMTVGLSPRRRAWQRDETGLFAIERRAQDWLVARQAGHFDGKLNKHRCSQLPQRE